MYVVKNLFSCIFRAYYRKLVSYIDRPTSHKCFAEQSTLDSGWRFNVKGYLSLHTTHSDAICDVIRSRVIVDLLSLARLMSTHLDTLFCLASSWNPSSTRIRNFLGCSSIGRVLHRGLDQPDSHHDLNIAIFNNQWDLQDTPEEVANDSSEKTGEAFLFRMFRMREKPTSYKFNRKQYPSKIIHLRRIHLCNDKRTIPTYSHNRRWRHIHGFQWSIHRYL